MQQELPNNVVNAYWANPLEDDCLEKMERFYTLREFKMVKLHQCWTPFEIYCSGSIEIIKWASDKKLPIFIHLFSDKEVSGFVEVANRFKNTTFIIGHMIGFTTMSASLENENVYFDISAPQLYSENILKSAIDKVGCERLILGSDSPYGVDNIDKNIRRLRKLKLTDSQIISICGENIVRILKIREM
ncbi:MAG: amidohydrolase family protein [Sarcina sp.]